MCIAGHWQKAKEGYIFSRRTWNLEGRGRDTDRKCVWRGREKWPCFYAERYIVKKILTVYSSNMIICDNDCKFDCFVFSSHWLQ